MITGPYPGPYPGLRPFEREEDILFFGREEQVDQLLDKLAETHFLAVLGTSGSGKSSLVKAGLLPALESGFMAGTGPRWDVAQIRPGDKPFRRLADSLIRDTDWGRARARAFQSETASEKDKEPNETAGETASEALENDLRRGGQALNWLLGVTPSASGTRMLILVDQFEELFRYHRRAGAEAAAFAALLLGAAAHPDVYVAITMRSEYLGYCSRFPDLPEAVNAGLFLVPSLTPEQMADAIQFPARLEPFGGDVSPELARRLLEEARGGTDTLPLLQHALMRLWDRAGEEKILDSAGLDDLGGLSGCLDSHAEEAYGQLTLEQRPIAEVMFRALAEPFEEQADTRRPCSLGEIASLSGTGADQAAAVAEVFRGPGRSFLMPPAGTELKESTILDITHEALIRQWKRLREWTENEKEQAELYRRLESAACRHKDGKGALWVDPDLEFALQWREERKPKKAWAARYGGDFDLAMAFLEKCREARDARREAEEERRRKEVRQAQEITRFSLMALMIAVRAENTAKRQERERTQSLFDSGVTHATLLAKVNDLAEARAVLRETALLDASISEHRLHARNLLAGYVDIMGGTAEKVYEGAGAALIDVAVSPDGRLLAAAGERGTLVLFDAGTGELVKRLAGHDASAGSTGSVRAVLFTPEGDMLYSAGDDRRIIRWSMPEGEKQGEWKAPDEVFALASSPDGKIMASGGNDDAITIWDVATNQSTRTLKGKTSLIADGNSLAFSPDGQWLVSGGYGGDAGIWDMNTGGERVLSKLHTDQVTAVAVSHDGRWIATGGGDKRIILWDAESGRPMRLLQGHENIVFGLAFNPDGSRLFSASRDNTLRLWDTATGVPLGIYQGHTAGLWSVAPRADVLYTAANDGTLRRWPADTPGQWVWEMPAGTPKSTAISPDGKSVAVGFENGAIRIFTIPAGKMVFEKENAHASTIMRLAFNPDGNLLATAGMDNEAKIWRFDRNPGGITLALLHTLKGHEDTVHAVAFSPDGRTLATAGYDGRVGLFDVESGEGELFEAFDGEDVNSVSFGKEGLLLLTQGDWKIRLWDISKRPPEPRDVARAMDMLLWAALRPDARQIAAVGREVTVTLYDTGPNAGPPRKLPGHEQAVFRAIYSPDGTQLATVSGDMTVRLWDLDTGKALFVLRLPTELRKSSPLWDFDFRRAPDGTCQIAVPLTMGRLALYRLPHDQPPPSIQPKNNPNTP